MQAGVVIRTSNMNIFHVVVWQTPSENCTKYRAACVAACVARLFFNIQLVKSLICGVHFAVAIVISLTPY